MCWELNLQKLDSHKHSNIIHWKEMILQYIGDIGYREEGNNRRKIECFSFWSKVLRTNVREPDFFCATYCHLFPWFTVYICEVHRTPWTKHALHIYYSCLNRSSIPLKVCINWWFPHPFLSQVRVSDRVTASKTVSLITTLISIGSVKWSDQSAWCLISWWFRRLGRNQHGAVPTLPAFLCSQCTVICR